MAAPSTKQIVIGSLAAIAGFLIVLYVTGNDILGKLAQIPAQLNNNKAGNVKSYSPYPNPYYPLMGPMNEGPTPWNSPEL